MLRPEVTYGTFVRLLDKTGEEYLIPKEHYAPRSHPDCEVVETMVGWFSCLSDDGYLDGTEWEGPFDSAEEARINVENLLE